MDNTIGIDKTMSGDGDDRGGGLPVGALLGQYRVLRLLGRGGMGEVYEVEHQVLHRRYALKVLPEDFVSRPGALERFQREAQVMANLEHLNIVRVDEFGESGGRYWLRMELVEGIEQCQTTEDRQQTTDRVVTLQDLADARGGKIPQQELLPILKQVLEGLAYAHEHGAIHRDLKPSNILLSAETTDHRLRTTDISTDNQSPITPSLSVKIADFGLVRLVGEEWVRSQAELSVQRSMSMGDLRTMAGDSSKGTSTRSMLGTFEYMSPEQKMGEEADARSDLYSVGLICFKLLTGKNIGLKLPSQIDRKLAGGWDGLVSELIDDDPDDRPDGCGQVLSALEGLAAQILTRHKEVDAMREAQEQENRRAVDLERHRIADEALRQRNAEAAEREKKKRSARQVTEEERRLRKERRREEKEKKVRSNREAKEQARKERARLKQEKAERRGKSSPVVKFIVTVLLLSGLGAYCWLLYQGVSTPRKTTRSPATTASGRTSTKPSTKKPVQTPRRTGGTRVERARKAGDTLTVDLGGGVKLDLVWCPAGEFMMGSPSTEEDRDDDERQHRVRLTKGFWLGKYEVTQEQWERVMGSNPSRFKGARNPVEQVSWEGCQRFVEELNKRVQRTEDGGRKAVFRLPTEAEWEYACRAGTSMRFSFGDSDADLWRYGNYCDRANTSGYSWQDKTHNDGHDKTAPMGSFRPNAWGLHDMHGNVWEWCQDWYGSYPTGTVTDPAGPGSGSSRVFRGGCWFTLARSCRSAVRSMLSPDIRDFILGLRLAMDQSP